MTIQIYIRPLRLTFRGRRIGYAFGSNAHYALLNTLTSAGLDESMLTLVPMEVTEMPKALHEGKIDAFAAWEPTPFITVKQYPETVIIHKSLSSGYMYFKREFFDKHPEIVRLFLAAEIRAINWMNTVMRRRDTTHSFRQFKTAHSLLYYFKKFSLFFRINFRSLYDFPYDIKFLFKFLVPDFNGNIEIFSQRIKIPSL